MAPYLTMRKLFKRLTPDRDSLDAHRSLRIFGNTLLHPRLWHLNRHSAAGAVAVGLFCGLIPGPFQMLGAALCAIALKINLPLALIVTLYTNPLTIVPLYVVAYELGRWLLDSNGAKFAAPPDFDWANLMAGIDALASWAIGLGKPLAVGLVALATLLAVAGYFIVRAAWRVHSMRAWQRRKNLRARNR
jgi:uncharacterized protein (DUF2062 family)